MDGNTNVSLFSGSRFSHVTFRDRKSFLPVLARVNGIVAAAARIISNTTKKRRERERESER